ncbi:unnamed protein product, partial [Symbiodinium sp. CCMP2456]
PFSSLLLVQPVKMAFQQDVTGWNTAIAEQGRAKHWHSAIQVLEQGEENREHPNAVTLNAVMGACDRASQWQYALSFLRCFHGRGLQPDVVTYNTALSACAKGSRWQLALALHRSGPGFAAAPALRACSQGQQWQLGLEFLRSLRAEDLDLRAFTAGMQACSLGGCWQLALQLLQEMEGLRHSADAIAISAAMGACEKAGHWAQALALFRGLRGRRLEPDVVSFNSALSSCAKGEAWQTALQLLWEACREVRPDVVTFNSALSATSRAHLWEEALQLHELLQTEVLANSVVRLTVIQACGMLEHWQKAVSFLPEDGRDEQESCSAANAALAAVGSWAAALHLVASMTISRIPASSVTCRSLARSCERTGHWQQALGMAQLDRNVSAESYKALIAACQASAATTAGAALLRQMHGKVTDPGFTWLWTLAKLQLQEAELRACAVLAAIRALEGTVSPAEFAMVSWSLATLGVASPQFRAACSRQASSLHRFTTEELGHLAFGLAASPDAEVFLQLQREVRARLKMVRWTQVAAPLRRKALEDDLLNVLWSCSFAGAVDPPLRRALGRCFRALGASLDKRFRNSPAPLHSSQALTGPSVRLELCDRLVLFKPVGWEVCDGNVGRQLRHFVNWKGSWPILQSAQHDYGFLHRVDVPCSGLILFAKSFRAYYDLQVQLRAGEIRRDYCVLCHGWFAQGQRRVNALVTWRGDGPTRSGSVGKHARTEFKALAHILLQFGTATLTVVRIATGRRHQIRSHCSFMGHAVVRDEKYTALQTQELDFHFCDSIFLHRHSLFFHDLGNGEHEVLDHLPSDLISALAGAAGKDPTSTAALNRVIHGDLKNWELSEPITCRMLPRKSKRIARESLNAQKQCRKTKLP